MPTTMLKTITLGQVSEPLAEDWAEELSKLIPSDQAPLSYEDMAERVCRRLIFGHLLQDGEVELVELHGVLHSLIPDMDSLGFFDPTWEEAFNNAWREICEEVATS